LCLLADEPATGISLGTSGEQPLVADGTGCGGGRGHGTSYPLYKRLYYENINTMTNFESAVSTNTTPRATTCSLL